VTQGTTCIPYSNKLPLLDTELTVVRVSIHNTNRERRGRNKLRKRKWRTKQMGRRKKRRKTKMRRKTRRVKMGRRKSEGGAYGRTENKEK
jgi:hypothetical protein